MRQGRRVVASGWVVRRGRAPQPCVPGCCSGGLWFFGTLHGTPLGGHHCVRAIRCVSLGVWKSVNVRRSAVFGRLFWVGLVCGADYRVVCGGCWGLGGYGVGGVLSGGWSLSGGLRGIRAVMEAAAVRFVSRTRCVYCCSRVMMWWAHVYACGIVARRFVIAVFCRPGAAGSR